MKSPLYFSERLRLWLAAASQIHVPSEYKVKCKIIERISLQNSIYNTKSDKIILYISIF